MLKSLGVNNCGVDLSSLFRNSKPFDSTTITVSKGYKIKTEIPS